MAHQDTRPDDQLIAAVQRGDEQAFEALYHRHKTYVARLAHRYTGDPELALDVVQEVFAYLVRRFADEPFTLTAKFTTYLYPVVKHTAQQARRKATREHATDPASLPESADAPPPQDPDDLTRVLAALPEAQREVLLLRFVDGLSVEETAAALDIPPGTVKSRLHHAIRALRDDPAVKKFFHA